MLGIAACVPTLRKTRSPANTRVRPSLRGTSSVFGATKRPVPMINSAPVVVVLQMQFYFAVNHVAFAFANGRHVGQ
jgi:hypothetical protein